jgi:hypothetical protein
MLPVWIYVRTVWAQEDCYYHADGECPSVGSSALRRQLPLKPETYLYLGTYVISNSGAKPLPRSYEEKLR